MERNSNADNLIINSNVNNNLELKLGVLSLEIKLKIILFNFVTEKHQTISSAKYFETLFKRNGLLHISYLECQLLTHI